MDNKLIEKIQKLLAMGNGTANGGENEAEVALAKAYALMQQNNIDMATVQSASREQILGALDKSSVTPPPMKVWEQGLFNCLMFFFDCENYYYTVRRNGTTQTTVYAIGRESNRITAIMMYKWLRQKIHEDSFAYKANQRQGYCFGAVRGISNKVHSIKKTAEQTDAWGIVPANEVLQWMEEHLRSIKTLTLHGQVTDWSAYKDGVKDGETVNLNHQVNPTALPCA